MAVVPAVSGDGGGRAKLAFRLDTHGGRFIEGLDPQVSYAVLERHAPGAIRRYRSETELRYLVGHRGFRGGDLAGARRAGRGGISQAVKITASARDSTLINAG